MERKQGAQPAPEESGAWWISFDEDYWRALLEQGEVATETTLPVGTHEPYFPVEPGSEQGVEPLGAQSGAEDWDRAGRGDEWSAAQLALERGDLLCLKVSGANRGGLLVDWNGMQGFVPASHLKEMPRHQDPQDRLAELTCRIGDSLTLRLIEVDPRQSRLVFSERAAQPSSRAPSAILDSLQPGEVCRGVVTNLTSFGAFVDLGGMEGLVHISEISWDRVHHPGDLLRPGMEVEAQVLGVNPEERRIALSLKRLRSNPWAQAEQRYQIGQVLEGTVTNVVSFGAFVRIAEGLEGLVHISELADGSFMHPRNVVREGDTVRVRVLNIDAANRRLGLSLRQAYGGERPS